MSYAAHFIDRLTRITALLGGGVLLLLVGMTVLSVIGRAINNFGIGPIAGDFELVEHGMVTVIFWALPWCQMRFGHVSVDVLARHFPKQIGWYIALLSQMGFILLSFLISLQLYYGMLDKIAWLETSMILQMPVWWGYAAALPASLLWVVSCIITAWQVGTRQSQEDML